MSAPYLKITFASESEKQELVAWAAAHGSPASKFLRAVLQELMAASGKPDRQGRRIAALQARLQSLEAELALKDGQLADLRAQVLRQSDLLQSHRQEGAGELPLRLIKVIEKERVVSERMLFVLLGIGPDDSEQREALGRQLEELEGFGMIKKGSNGWRWVK
jgi:hypothetical protein